MSTRYCLHFHILWFSLQKDIYCTEWVLTVYSCCSPEWITWRHPWPVGTVDKFTFKYCHTNSLQRFHVKSFIEVYIEYIDMGVLATVYPKKYAHGFVVLCFVVVMQSFIMNSHEVFIHIHQVCFAGTGAIVRLPQCQWSKPDGYGKISQCITTTKHSKAKTVCIFLGKYCTCFCIRIDISKNSG